MVPQQRKISLVAVAVNHPLSISRNAPVSCTAESSPAFVDHDMGKR